MARFRAFWSSSARPRYSRTPLEGTEHCVLLHTVIPYHFVA